MRETFIQKHLSIVSEVNAEVKHNFLRSVKLCGKNAKNWPAGKAAQRPRCIPAPAWQIHGLWSLSASSYFASFLHIESEICKLLHALRKKTQRHRNRCLRFLNWKKWKYVSRSIYLDAILRIMLFRKSQTETSPPDESGRAVSECVSFCGVQLQKDPALLSCKKSSED